VRKITPRTSLKELAALVSQALEEAGVRATLSGGAAVSIYSDNQYQSRDLDFVSYEQIETIGLAIEPLGFHRRRNERQFEHADTIWYVEFPPGPIAFGDRVIDETAIPIFETEYGPLRIVTPTQIVMDRMAAYIHWQDNQSLDQARLVAMRSDIDWDELCIWAQNEGIDQAEIDSLKP